MLKVFYIIQVEFECQKIYTYIAVFQIDEYNLSRRFLASSLKIFEKSVKNFSRLICEERSDRIVHFRCFLKSLLRCTFRNYLNARCREETVVTVQYLSELVRL